MSNSKLTDAISGKRGFSNEASSLDDTTRLDTGLEELAQTSTSSAPITAFGGPYTALDAPLETISQRTPHRAWEEGYQSPYSQTDHNPVNSLSLPSAYSALPLAALNNSNTPQDNISTPPSQRDTYRPRMKRVTTKEITLEDLDFSAVVTLGMSPFMTGQDIIANQNRFVRNECIFARHFLRLQKATSDSDARHANIAQNIYEHLEQHKLALDKFAGGVTDVAAVSNGADIESMRTDPDFIVLEKAHEETRARLEELSRQVAESLESIQRTLMDLAHRVDQISVEIRSTI